MCVNYVYHQPILENTLVSIDTMGSATNIMRAMVQKVIDKRAAIELEEETRFLEDATQALDEKKKEDTEKSKLRKDAIDAAPKDKEVEKLGLGNQLRAADTHLDNVASTLKRQICQVKTRCDEIVSELGQTPLTEEMASKHDPCNTFLDKLKVDHQEVLAKYKAIHEDDTKTGQDYHDAAVELKVSYMKCRDWMAHSRVVEKIKAFGSYREAVGKKLQEKTKEDAKSYAKSAKLQNTSSNATDALPPVVVGCITHVNFEKAWSIEGPWAHSPSQTHLKH